MGCVVVLTSYIIIIMMIDWYKNLDCPWDVFIGAQRAVSASKGYFWIACFKFVNS